MSIILSQIYLIATKTMINATYLVSARRALLVHCQTAHTVGALRTAVVAWSGRELTGWTVVARAAVPSSRSQSLLVTIPACKVHHKHCLTLLGLFNG